MREALTEFLQEVRAAGVPLSLAESIDALRAASAVLAEREILREALAAAVVKDESDRPVFDETFDRFFAVGEDEGSSARKRRRRAGQGAGAGRSPALEPPPRSRGRAIEPRPPDEPRREGKRATEKRAQERSLRRRALLRTPFREMDPLEAEALQALASELSRRFRVRLRRRTRRGKRGRLDFRRTLRRSVAHGGAPFDLVLRRRRPARPDLVAVCDVSGSVRYASEFFAAVLAPCADFFRRVRLFVFVDHPVEASVEEGRLVPHETIDFHAFSDFGRVFTEIEEMAIPFGRSTVLLILGDARNNRRPARADALARLRSNVRTLWWLNPEAQARWGRGDSAIASYAPHCDAVLECADAAGLLRALARVAR